MIDACIDPGSAFALCVIAFAAGSTVMVAFVLALGLLGDFVDRIDEEDGPGVSVCGACCDAGNSELALTTVKTPPFITNTPSPPLIPCGCIAATAST
jgi:hypothetical protein